MSSRSNPGASTGRKPNKAQIQQRQAAARAIAAARGRKEQRNRQLKTVGIPLLVVVLVIGVLVVVYLANKKGPNKATVADAAVVQAVTSVPASVINAVGVGSGASGPVSKLPGPALTANGKPRILFVGAEFCPYCAAERWALVNSLSRFGTFKNLGETRSEPGDPAGSDIPTLDFHGASYGSKYVSLTAKEIEDGSGKPLEKLDSADAKLFSTIGSGFPFIDLAGKYNFGAQYAPTTLGGAGKTQADIAGELSDPSSTITKAIIGSANIFTAAVCQSTNQQPGAVCAAPGVKAAAPILAKAKTDATSGG